jgi:hypothetical protein
MVEAHRSHFIIRLDGMQAAEGDEITISKRRGAHVVSPGRTGEAAPRATTASAGHGGRGATVVSSVDIEQLTRSLAAHAAQYRSTRDTAALHRIEQLVHRVLSGLPASEGSRLQLLQDIARNARELLQTRNEQTQERLVAALHARIGHLTRTAQVSVSSFHSDTPVLAHLSSEVSMPARLAYFTDMRSALSWLMQMHTDIPEKTLQRCLRQTSMRGASLIKILPASPQTMSIQFLDPRHLSRESAHIRTSLSSPLWQHLSQNDLSSVLSSMGSVNLSRMRAVDRWLSAGATAVPPAAQSQQGYRDVAMQWLLHALDERIPLSSLPQASPFASPSRMLHSLQDLLSLDTPSGPSERSAETDMDTAGPLSRIVRQMGFTFENECSRHTASPHTSSSPVSPSIKKTLLVLQSMLSPEAPAPPSRAEAPSTTSAYTRLSAALARLSILLESAPSRAAAQVVEHGLSRLEHELARWSSQDTGPFAANNTAAAVSAAPSSPGTGAAGDTAQNTSLPPLPPVSHQRIQQLLQTLQRIFHSLLRTTLNTGDTPGTRDSATSDSAPSTPADTARAAPYSVDAETLRQRLEPILQRIERAYLNTLQHRYDTAESMQRAVQNAMQRFESLQLLARPAHTAQGEQFVLVVPVRMGDAHIDVRLRVVRRKPQKKKHARDAHTRVFLNIAPRNLGAVQARLDAFSHKRIACHIRCENPETTARLTEAKPQVLSALRNKDLSIQDISIRTGAPVDDSNTPSNGTTAGGGRDDAASCAGDTNGAFDVTA